MPTQKHILELKGAQADGKAILIEHSGGLIEIYGSGRADIAVEVVTRVNWFEALHDALDKMYHAAEPEGHAIARHEANQVLTALKIMKEHRNGQA